MRNFANTLKTAFLLGAMIGLFVLVGSYWGQQGMIVGLLFGGVMNFFAWFFSDKIAIASMRGKRVDAQSAPDLYATVERLAARANLPMPRVYICPHDAPNAFATGRSPRKAAVAVTQGLLRLMNQQELEGVIAHELAHVKNRDTLTSCIAATIAGVLAWLAQWGFFMMGGGGRRDESGNAANPIVMIIVVIGAALGAAIIKAMISRTREFVADADGARIAGTTRGLASALQQLDAYSRRIPLVQPNPAQNNLFIVEPLAGGSRSLVNLFATHPPTEARVAALQRLEMTENLNVLR